VDKKEMISELAKELPPYAAHLRGEFIPGKTLVQYSGPYWDNEEVEAGLKAFLSGHWASSGEYVARFQNEFARQFSVRYAQMVNSGSSANLVMLAALKKRLGWQDGDEVIVSPTGFPTTISTIVQNGLKPIFVDIEMQTLNFDLEKVQSAITSKTKAIFVSPVLGNSPNIDQLRSFTKLYDHVTLILDGCDSLGSKWSGEDLGNYFYAWSTSFYPAHHITTLEGGMVSSNDADLIKLVRSFSNWGRSCHCVGKANLLPCGTCGLRFSNWLGEEQGIIDHKYVFEHIGYNLKPLDLQGALGLAQLKKLKVIEAKRRYNKEEITEVVNSLPKVRVVSCLPQSDPCWFAVPIVCEDKEIRESLVAHLEKNLVQTRPVFAANILMHPGYSHLGKSKDYPNACLAYDRTFFIGCAPFYTEEILDYIAGVLDSWPQTLN
jgi:CDP-6-deoxy-D-xylo-4-hexulose-3-dehydrase